MTLLKDNNYKDINVALLSLEADIKNKITNFDTSEIDKQLAEINSSIDKINAGGGSDSSDEIEDINSKLNSNSIKIRNIEQNIEDIGTQINGIEQKLSDIFSAESKVTDFNATTNSGIYYWVTDAANRPTDYGVLLVNKYYNGGDITTGLWVNQIAYGTNNKIYFRQNINSGNWTEWETIAFITDIKGTTTKTLNLNTVSDAITKYIKLGTFNWYDNFSFRCRLYGNAFEDNININILNGDTDVASVCGYYSTNSRRTKAIIVKRGDTWHDDIEIYLQVSQATTLSIGVTIDKDYQDRINISESTTAPSGTLEEIVFNNINGMFINNIDAKNLTGTADKAVEVVDYDDTSRTVRIGYHGPGVTADELLHLAGYTEDDSSSVKLKDVSKEEIIKWLGIPRVKYADYMTEAHTFSSLTEYMSIDLSKFGPDVREDNVLSFMVIWWSGIPTIAQADWAAAAGSSGLKCQLHPLAIGNGQALIRCVYLA